MISPPKLIFKQIIYQFSHRNVCRSAKVPGVGGGLWKCDGVGTSAHVRRDPAAGVVTGCAVVGASAAYQVL